MPSHHQYKIRALLSFIGSIILFITGYNVSTPSAVDMANVLEGICYVSAVLLLCNTARNIHLWRMSSTKDPLRRKYRRARA